MGLLLLYPVIIGISVDLISWIRSELILRPYLNNWSSKFNVCFELIKKPFLLFKLSKLALTPSVTKRIFPPFIIYWSNKNLSNLLNGTVGEAIIVTSYLFSLFNWLDIKGSFLILSYSNSFRLNLSTL